jgi:transposase
VDTLEPAAPARCPSCGGERLLAKDWEVSTKFTAVRGFVRKLEIRREVCTCADCNARVCAPMPPMPWKASQFTPELVALVVHTKFTLGVPLDRLYQDLRRQGVNLAWSSLVYLIDRAARLFDVVDGEHWKQLKAGPVLGVDGTGLDVVVPGLGETWHGYLDVFCRDDIHVYQYSPTKHADVLKEKLGRYAGTVVCDAEYRNDILFGPGIVEANCNAHPRRKLRDAEAREPVLARQAREFLDRMYAVEEEARRHGLNGAALLRLRQARTRPVAEKFRRWISETVPTLLPSNPVGKVLRYYDRHFTALTRFVDDPNLPIDNNRSERAFQVHAKLRVAAEFAGSTEGAHRWATLLGVVNTAKRLDVDVLAYLTWAIERLGTWRKIYALPAAQLTPEAYKLTCAAGATAA